MARSEVELYRDLMAKMIQENVGLAARVEALQEEVEALRQVLPAGDAQPVGVVANENHLTPGGGA